MKKRRIPAVLLGVLLMAEFIREYSWIAAFAGIWLALMLAWIAHDMIKDRRNRKRSEEAQAEAEEAARNRRNRKYQKSRYTPEDRAALEAHIQEKLGPVIRLDRETESKRLPIDAVLLGPAEGCPCWRAATAGLGACEGEWPRAEMVIPLGPDWDPDDLTPFRLLRDAARQFLVSQGWIGLGSACRGSVPFINAGFAGAVLYDTLKDLPDMESASLPGAGPVMFYWLIPLKKAEWDYAGERGLDALERRMENPASCWSREPWVDAGTWFEEDIMPFAWSCDGELYCLGLQEMGWFRQLFVRVGIQECGWGMESLAEAYLYKYQREDVPFVEFSCDKTSFFAASRDEEIMRKLALGLSDLLRYQPNAALSMLLSDR